MITYSNIQRFDRLEFPDYLQLPGYSHSFLKSERGGVSEDLFITENIRIGKLVDAILTDVSGVDMNDTLYPVAANIAYNIQKSFGSLIKHFESQVSYTGTVEFGSFSMPVKGRLDWLLKNRAVIDLKVTKSKNIHSLVEFMGYKNQIFHYAKLAGVNKGFLMIYSIPLRKTELIRVDCQDSENEFWQEKIVSFGRIKENVSEIKNAELEY